MRLRFVYFCFPILLGLVSSHAVAANGLKQFNLPKPSARQMSKKMYLWATYYYVHTAYHKRRRGYRLRQLNGKPLPARVSAYDFCHGAMQGTLKVRKRRGKTRVYNYAGLGKKSQVNCQRYFPQMNKRITRALGKTRFKPSRGRFGEGIQKYLLYPFRSIAVDSRKIPYGSLIYIPQARGTRFRYQGRTYTHDGYFFASDTGGAINYRHIDVFVGPRKHNPFAFVTSKKHQRFKAYIIWNAKLRQRMKRWHLQQH